MILAHTNYTVFLVLPQQVVLKWEDTGYASYRIDYECDNGANGSEAFQVVNKTIYNKNFVPYSSCRFCTTNLPSYGGLRSEPVCKVTRLAEKPPESPPLVTSDFKTCPTRKQDEKRVVTVMCKFPNQNTRNGKLNKLKVIFSNSTNNASTYEESTTNLILCQVAVGGLDESSNYYPQLSVCNSAGCSPLSDVVLTFGTAAVLHEKTQGYVINLLWLTLLVLGAIIIIALFVFKMKQIEKEPRGHLPGVHEPNIYEDVTKLPSVNSYDQLPNGIGHENYANDEAAKV